MKNEQQGFTLVELMIVVAIIGILAAVAIPAYQDYTIRAQVSEGLSLSSAAKASIAEYFALRGLFPTDNAEAGLEAAGNIQGKYVSLVTVGNKDGVVTVTYGNSAHQTISGQAITLSANTAKAGSVQWLCDSPGAVIADKHLPAACR